MQQAASHKLPTLGPGVGFAVSLRRVPLALIQRLASWQRQSEERAQLLKLSDRQLRDIGLRRGDAVEMARKAVWQR